MDSDAIIQGVVLLIFSSLLGWIGYIIKDMRADQKDLKKQIDEINQSIAKVSASAAAAMNKAENATNTEEVRAIIVDYISKVQAILQANIDAVRDENGKSAQRVLKSLDGLEGRFDALMLHLMNKVDNK